MYVSGLNLPDRDYYIKRKSKIFGEYRIFLCDLMKLLDLKLENPSPDLKKLLIIIQKQLTTMLIIYYYSRKI